jgi:hypothetical protein
MKPVWKVSMAAMPKRSYDLGKTSLSMYPKLNTQISKYGFKTAGPIPIIPEEPTVLRDLINVHLKEHGYSRSELADLLLAGEARFRKFYFPNETSNQLRLVG